MNLTQRSPERFPPTECQIYEPRVALFRSGVEALASKSGLDAGGGGGYENIAAIGGVVPCGAGRGGVLAEDKATQEKPMVSQENPLSAWNKFA